MEDKLLYLRKGYARRFSDDYCISPKIVFTRDALSGNAVNFKATNEHTAIYVEEVHEGTYIICFRLINI